MADNVNVLTESQLETIVDDENAFGAGNPDVVGTNTSVGPNRQIIHLTLVVEGVTVDIGQLYDSLATTGADVSAVTRVVALTGEKSSGAARNTFIWNIGPT